MAMSKCLNFVLPFTRVGIYATNNQFLKAGPKGRTQSCNCMSKSGSSSGNMSQGSTGSGVPINSPPIPRNRFQKSANQAMYELKETKDCVIYRVDLPGCPASDLAYWIDGNNVHFFADEPVMSEYDHDGRKYGGTMVFNPVAYNVSEAKAN
ncbi:hypothetical protein Rs2_15343 [Raphanus sativus]|nr:hypothetical protein Rs2_15343 [Raphanus sativus]